MAAHSVATRIFKFGESVCRYLQTNCLRKSHFFVSSSAHNKPTSATSGLLFSRTAIKPSVAANQHRCITSLTRFNVVDNSALGQRTKRNSKAYLIGFYRKRKTADIGDVIRVAVGGKTNKAIVVGTRKTKHHSIPRYDNNNIVLVDDNLAPLGTRIKGPIPSIIRRRQAKYSKVLAIASRFI
ncbi:39S ribosomal protein L14, mitochondrial [Exaiptasia diaphana]|uniref:Large ribosomal subunit protein uL14m n=1 Tax=Exaiptasia diaphana TaxID=2652724 RepID=A0A913WY28_EXADI|nr:39S ribosomal protein L14, mitochondrial [Exaiptasia diaphana]KXJ16875.1 39S ribosomal protein L14, mitochondrial [Exaiptasia diaphana]